MTNVALAETAVPKGLIGGPFGSSLVGADYAESGVPVIRGTNLVTPPWVSGDFAYVSEAKYSADLSRNTAIPGDLVFTQRGTLGQVGVVPLGVFERYVISQSQMRLRVDATRFDPRFIYYACSTTAFARQIDDNAIRTGVPHINLGILGRLEIPAPTIAKQRGIAEVLGALDDKITANARTASTATDLARTIFQQAVTAAPRRRMSEVLTPVLGGTPARATSEFWGGEVPWASAKDVVDAPGGALGSTAETITKLATEATKVKPLPSGSVILTARGTVGAVARLTRPAAFNQSCYGFVPGALPAGLLFLAIENAAHHARSLAHGSVFDTITMRSFDHLTVPDFESASAPLESEVSGLLDLASSQHSQNAVLAETRDALLPLLMSRKVTVADAESVVGEVL